MNKDDLYTVKCKHCQTVRSVNNAPAILYCTGGCKKLYRCNLELGSNKHWEVRAEADDRDEQQENGTESDEGDDDFEFEMDISEFVPSQENGTESDDDDFEFEMDISEFVPSIV